MSGKSKPNGKAKLPGVIRWQCCVCGAKVPYGADTGVTCEQARRELHAGCWHDRGHRARAQLIDRAFMAAHREQARIGNEQRLLRRDAGIPLGRYGRRTAA